MKKKLSIKTRIAPTPSGFLHLGNIYSFVLTWLYSKQNDGDLLLRIDDLDRARVRIEYIDDIFRTLDWLEIEYDEGPSGSDDFLKNYSQHNRLDIYNDYLKQLKEKHHLFNCICSRAKIKLDSTDGQYAGTCLKQPKNNNTLVTWRLNHTKDLTIAFNDLIRGKVTTNLWQQMRYPVLKRKDGLPAYQVASIADDTHFNISAVVRGADLINSTAIQLHLSQLLCENSFSKNTFLHHNLVLDIGNKGHKLSKSQQAPAIKTWREKKNGKVLLFRKLAVLLNVDPNNIESIDDLLQQFKLSQLKVN